MALVSGVALRIKKNTAVGRPADLISVLAPEGVGKGGGSRCRFLPRVESEQGERRRTIEVNQVFGTVEPG